MRGSKQDLPVAVELPGITIRVADWGNMTVGAGKLPRRARHQRPSSRGCPTIAASARTGATWSRGGCASSMPIATRSTAAGDAYYAPPGHTTLFEEDTETVEFSPQGLYQETMEVAAPQRRRDGGRR